MSGLRERVVFQWIRNLFHSQPTRPDDLRPVPGALVARQGNRVIYNMLDPTMKKFMGQCIGAIKKANIRAKGTGQFSILLGENAVELVLDDFWKEYAGSGDAAVFQKVVEAAKDTLDLAE
jgi:hypothetical protein